MSDGFNLEILRKHRQALLLAEAAACLHNIGKLSEEFLKRQADEQDYKNYDYQAISGLVSVLARADLTPEERKRLRSATMSDFEPKTSGLLSHQQKQWLQARWLKLPQPLDDHPYALGDWIEFQDFGWYKPTKGGSPPRIKLLFPTGSRATELLEASHNAASGIEKEGTPKDEGKQTQFPMYLSSAFGFEFPINTANFKNWRNELFESLPAQGRSASAWSYLEKAVGDTRRPINEVRLSDLSFSVASLFKSALAQAVLSQKWSSRDDLRWRLLRVNFDVLGLYAKAIRIADLLGYKHAVEQACRATKELVEVEYPLGNEVYRDTTGIYFTFPDLDLPAELEQEIRHRVEGIEPELAPRIAVTCGDGATAQDQLKGILGKARGEARETLKLPFDAVNLSSAWQKIWDDILSQEPEKKWEVCPVCHLRPKEEHAKVCEHCQQRRGSRLEGWKQNPSQTIWLGEIADHNDRLALLVGKFGLDDWLSGDLVQTMLVKAERNNPAGCTPKNPSPARLRRVWETCLRFWDDIVLQNVLSKILGNRGTRQHIIPNTTNWQPVLYNGKINGKPLDLFWQPASNAFLTVSSLHAAGAFKQGDTITLENPDTKQEFEFQIQGIRNAPSPFSAYHPYLPLLTSPDQFLALVPAADALTIVQNIRGKYEKKFGKVRNRLPLFLGVVYFERKMPLMAVMDAARQLLNVPLDEEDWGVKQDVADGKVQFKNGVLWEVPIVMGDGNTPDEWYPYYFVTQIDSVKHPRRFQLRREGDTDLQKVDAVSERYADRWLVHVNDLKQDDVISITPSRFDFLWLDAASRRFDLAYDKEGRRFDRPSRPFYLEDLQRLESLWGCLKQLTRTQLKQTLQTIETQRERWFGSDAERRSANDATFRQFVQDTLANAQWDWGSIPLEQKNQLIAAGVRGELADLEELHLEILKEQNEGVTR